MRLDESLSEVIRRFSEEMAAIENSLRAFADRPDARQTEQPRTPSDRLEPAIPAVDSGVCS